MGTEDESQSWYWADSDGVQSIVDEFELLSSLSTGTLPAYTLVWRVGWREWIPASRVAELANVLPKNTIESPIEPELDPKMEEPPPPPVDKYQAYRAREAAKLLGGSRQTMPTPTRPPLGAIVPGGVLGPPQAPPRPPQPTLLEPGIAATATLRPPGAVPPPPRAVPQPQAPAPIPPPPVAPVAPMAPVIRVGPQGPESTDRPTSPRAAPSPVLNDRLPSWSDEVDRELGGGAPPPVQGAGVPLAPAYAPPPTRRGPVVLVVAVILGLGALIVVAAAVIIVVRAQSTEPLGSSTAGGAASAPGSAREPLRACRIARPAARLAPSVSVAVTPALAGLPDGKIAVGFAASQKQAEGISVDPVTLSIDRTFREDASGTVASVVPMVSGGARTFAVDVESDAMRSPRSLDTSPRVTLGWTDAGFARATGSADPVTLWAGATEKVSDTRVVPLAAGGFAVAVRRGGKREGAVLVGRLDSSGASQGAPVELDAGTQVGTPAIAANDEGLLVAYASRPSEGAYWTLRLATAGGSDLPARARAFALPPGGFGADAISPAVTGLSHGRWLLQWTEGAAGRRQVRLQTVGPDLVPVGDPLTLSSEEANAGQGVVMVRDGKGLSLFLVSKSRSHELWGASLSCP